MSRVEKTAVAVNVTMALQVRPVTLERWRKDPTVLEQYALGSCFRNHSRTLIGVAFEADKQSHSVSDERRAGRDVCQPVGQFAFIVRCPSDNHWPLAVFANDWQSAVALVARGLVDDVGADARRWWIEHAIDASAGSLEFVRGADLGDLSAAVEARLVEIEASKAQVA